MDAGPIIHLEEIDRREPWGIFDELWLPEPVAGEIERRPEGPGADLIGKSLLEVQPVDGQLRDVATRLAMRHEISFVDGTVLGVAKARDLPLVLTDDLDLRDAAKIEGIRPVGSIGLILRATQDGHLGIELALEALTALHERSSLFITADLIERVQDAMTAHE